MQRISMRSIGFAAVCIGALLVTPSVAARDAKPVRTNPFARPLVVAEAPAARSGATRADTPSQRAVPQLRGVLQAGENSFANVGGTIVGLGESVANLTLQSVTEFSAVFLRNGRKITLEVSAGPEADASAAGLTLPTPPREEQLQGPIQGRTGQDSPAADLQMGVSANTALKISDTEKDKRSASRG